MDATLQIVLQFGALGLLALVLLFLGRFLANHGAAFLRELVETLKEIRADLKASRLEAAERHGELREHITEEATRVRHHARNLALGKRLTPAGGFPDLGDDDEDQTPVGGIRRPKKE